MFEINWKKGVDENIPESEQICNRYVLLLCLFIAKRDLKYRNSIKGKNSFNQYLNYYLINKSLFSNNKKEPYNSILNKYNDKKIDHDLQINILHEYEKYNDILDDNHVCFAKLVLILSIITIFFVSILFIYNSLKSSTFPVLYALLSSVIIMLVIQSIHFLLVNKNPEHNITAYLNYYLSDRRCINSLDFLYKKIRLLSIRNSNTDTDESLHNPLVNLIHKTHNNIPDNLIIKMCDAELLIPIDNQFEIKKGKAQVFISYLYSHSNCKQTDIYKKLFINNKVQSNPYDMDRSEDQSYKSNLSKFQAEIENLCND